MQPGGVHRGSALKDSVFGWLIRESFRYVWRLTFILPAALVVLLAIAYLAFAKPKFSSAVVLLPTASGDSGGGLAQLAGRYAGLLSATGLGAGSDQQSRNVELLKSRDVGIAFIKEADLLPKLFPDRWDSEAGVWINEPGLMSWLIPPIDMPNYQLGFERFEEKRSISRNERSGTITVEFTFRNPELAAAVAAEFVDYVDSAIRESDLAEIDASLSYLTESIDQAVNPEMISALGNLLESQLQKKMLIIGREDYAFSAIDPAVVPIRKSHPKSRLLLLLAMMTGGLLGVVAVELDRMRRLDCPSSGTE